MCALCVLDVASNQLTALPTPFRLPALRVLNCSNNPALHALPMGIERCTSLRTLLLEGCAVSAARGGFPSTLAGLVQLALVSLVGNPVVSPNGDVEASAVERQRSTETIAALVGVTRANGGRIATRP